MPNDIVRHNATELSVVQAAAVAAMAGGSSVTAAAATAGVDRTTVHRWLADDPRFTAALNAAKRDALDAIRAEVRAGAAEAVRTVRELMAARHSGPGVRLRSALALLNAVGALDPEAIGPTDPEDAEVEAKRRDFGRMVAKLGV